MISLLLLTAGAVALSSYGWRHSMLFLLGGLLGVSLYHSGFGFASAYRKLVVQREVRGLLAQLVMLAIATLLFAPVLASGTAFGQAMKGAVSPIGVQGAIGAVLFGIGMQLGGACGCGTLYTVGGGSVAMVMTLITFCMGAFWASLTRQLWAGLPSQPSISLGNTIGWTGAVLVQWALLMVLAGLLIWWGRTADTPDTPTHVPLVPRSLRQLVSGPWSLLTGAIALAVLNWLTLLLSGQPWRITWGFALWAAQLATALGWNPASSPFWSSSAGQQALNRGVLADVSSVMNIGIVLGALMASALAGRWQPKAVTSVRSVLATLLGGLMMGYGAFIAFGCNVSAFFSGIASTSVHGWVWIACALVGTLIGVYLRPLFRLPR